jgi:hypothetical protein
VLLIVLANNASAATTKKVVSAVDPTGSWTVRGHGHCAQQDLFVYTPGPYIGGQLFSWLGRTQLCDSSDAAPIVAVRIDAFLMTTKATSCSPGRNYTGGRTVFSTPSPTNVGAATWFDAGDGHTPPPEAIGTVLGEVPQVLGPPCTGDFDLSIATYVAEYTNPAVWVKVGKTHYSVSVGTHPQLSEPRPLQQTLDHLMQKNGHCVATHLDIGGVEWPPKVGDLFEFDFWGSTETCGDFNVYGLGVFAQVWLPEGCTAQKWLHPGGGVQGGGPGPTGAMTLWDYRYGLTGWTPPPYFNPPADGGGGGGPAATFFNCPGTWTIYMRAIIQGDPGGKWIGVGSTKFTFVVLAP